MSLFGCLFVGDSFPITDAAFTRTDETHWVLDVSAAVTPDFRSLKEVALFLVSPATPLPPDTGLALYVSVGGTGWSYRGYVGAGHPSEVMPLQWPDLEGGGAPNAAVLGVSAEPLAELSAKEGSKLGARADFAKAVATDLFRYMESFAQGGGGGGMLVVPTNVLEHWYTRLSHKLARDPDWLTRLGNKA